MDEFKRKYEKQTDNKKSKIITIKVNQEAYNRIIEKYKESECGSLTEYVTRSCIDCQIQVIPYAKDILQTLHTTHTAIRALFYLTNTQELSNAVSEMCLTLINKKDYINRHYY